MARKNKYALETPFTLEVCNALRFHAGMADALASQRENAFGERDSAANDKHEAEAGSEDHAEACTRHSDAIEKIDDLNTKIKWHSKTMIELVKKGDSPDLEVLYDPPTDPPAKPKGAKKQSDDVPGQATLAPEVPVPTGEDQQLTAAIAELDVTDAIKKRITGAGFSQIGHLSFMLDKGQDLGAACNLTERQTELVTAAVKAYRKDHRRAIAQADKEGAAPKR